MSQNPLQQFFRQPKIYISLPSHGIYNKPGTIQGDVEHIAVYGMTGMDEILLKTPDALLTGESTKNAIKSCCPSIKDVEDLCVLDLDTVLAAIRIATYGNTLSITHTCAKCSEENEYDIELPTILDHYSNCKYDNKVVLDGLTVKLKPLTYQETTDFSIRNFQNQQRLSQLDMVEQDEERKKMMNDIYQNAVMLNHEVFLETIESVDVGNTVVSERQYIVEWIEKCDREVTDKIKDHIKNNREAWSSPKHEVECAECKNKTSITLDLDLSNFFANA